MSLTFHWFLPTNGDSRHVVGGGHGTPATAAGGDRPPTLGLPQPDRPRRRGPRLRRRAHPDRRLVRGRLADHRDAQPAHRAAEVPGRLPARASSRPRSPRRWPPPSSGSPAGGCCSTSSPAARATSSAPTATSSTRTPATARPTSSCRSSGTCGTARRVDLDGRAPAGRGRHGWPGCPTRCPRSTSAAPRRSPGEVAARHADVYLTWGEPPAAGRREDRLDPAAGRRARAARLALRHPAARHHPRHRRAGVGGGRPAARRLRPGDRASRPGRARPQRVRGPAADARPARRRAGTAWRSTPTCGRASAWSAAARAPRWSAATTEVADRIEEYHGPRHRRVRPLRLPAPGGGVLVRRGRPAAAAGPGLWTHPHVSASRPHSVAAGAVRGARRPLTRPPADPARRPLTAARRPAQPQAGSSAPAERISSRCSSTQPRS